MKVKKSVYGVLDGRVDEMTRLLRATNGGIYGVNDFEYYWKAERYDRSRR